VHVHDRREEAAVLLLHGNGSLDAEIMRFARRRRDVRRLAPNRPGCGGSAPLPWAAPPTESRALGRRLPDAVRLRKAGTVARSLAAGMAIWLAARPSCT
jgi:pimeloyl-ACP methyl ester carboxylesterase